MASPRILKLQSSDGEIFEVEESVAVLSLTIKNLVDDVDSADGVFPLPNVTSETLAKVIEWCKEQSKEANVDLEKKFMAEMESDDLYVMLMAANYLEVRSLLDSCCQKAADMIKGKTPQQIRDTFNIVNDFTPEQENEIRNQNSWAFN